MVGPFGGNLGCSVFSRLLYVVKCKRHKMCVGIVVLYDSLLQPEGPLPILRTVLRYGSFKELHLSKGKHAAISPLGS